MERRWLCRICKKVRIYDDRCGRESYTPAEWVSHLLSSVTNCNNASRSTVVGLSSWTDYLSSKDHVLASGFLPSRC